MQCWLYAGFYSRLHEVACGSVLVAGKHNLLCCRSLVDTVRHLVESRDGRNRQALAQILILVTLHPSRMTSNNMSRNGHTSATSLDRQLLSRCQG